MHYQKKTKYRQSALTQHGKRIKMTNSRVINFVSNLKKGCGTRIETETVPKMNKGGNPFFGRVTKKTVYTGVQLGTSYQNGVESAQTRSGETAGYQSEKPNGKHYINEFILQSDKDNEVYYLQFQYTQGQLNANTVKITSTYFVDGKAATEAELNDLKAFLGTHSPSKKQMEAGVDLDEIRFYLAPKIENVTKIVQGSYIYEK